MANHIISVNLSTLHTTLMLVVNLPKLQIILNEDIGYRLINLTQKIG